MSEQYIVGSPGVSFQRRISARGARSVFGNGRRLKPGSNTTDRKIKLDRSSRVLYRSETGAPRRVKTWRGSKNGTASTGFAGVTRTGVLVALKPTLISD